MVVDFRSKLSNAISNLSVLFDCVEFLSQSKFNAFRPFDLSSAQMCSPLLAIHINQVILVLFEKSSKVFRKLLIILSSC